MAAPIFCCCYDAGGGCKCWRHLLRRSRVKVLPTTFAVSKVSQTCSELSMTCFSIFGCRVKLFQVNQLFPPRMERHKIFTEIQFESISMNLIYFSVFNKLFKPIILSKLSPMIPSAYIYVSSIIQTITCSSLVEKSYEQRL